MIPGALFTLWLCTLSGKSIAYHGQNTKKYLTEHQVSKQVRKIPDYYIGHLLTQVYRRLCEESTHFVLFLAVRCVMHMMGFEICCFRSPNPCHSFLGASSPLGDDPLRRMVLGITLFNTSSKTQGLELWERNQFRVFSVLQKSRISLWGFQTSSTNIS